jgi:transposase
VLAGERDWLLARIKEKADLTLRAIQAELAERGVIVSYDAVWRFFNQEGVTFKKSLRAAEQTRPDVARLPGQVRPGRSGLFQDSQYLHLG